MEQFLEGRQRGLLSEDFGMAAIPAEIAERQTAPLVTVRITRNDREESFVCRTELELPSFLASLDAASYAVTSPLLDAVKYVLRNEIYAAAFAFFDWLHMPIDVDTARIDCSQPSGGGVYPVYDLRSTRLVNREDRAGLLIAAFDGYEAGSGNDQVRAWFLEALAFTLSRYCGIVGEYDLGLRYVERAHRHVDGPRSPMDRSLHLEACRYSLELKRLGGPVPPRLEKYVGHDSGVLNDVVCRNPFTHFETNQSGSVYMCCPHLLPTAIGDITKESARSIWNSAAAQKLRESVVDGSFRYCDHVNCHLMVGNALPRKDSIEIKSDPVVRAGVEDHEFHVDPVEYLLFGYDESCNLSCPSCRRGVYIRKFEEAEIASVEAKVASLLPHVKVLAMNPCGEFLQSKPSRRVLQAIDPEKCPQLKLHIISNGTLFSESEYAKFPQIHGRIAILRISTDAATRGTFETIRRGGKWDRFLENLRFLARLRAEGEIGFLFLAFTYQLGNFREMKDFVRFGEEIGVDRVNFEKLLRTSDAMTTEEYAERAVHRPDHPLYPEFLEIVSDPIFRLPNVFLDR